MENEKKESEETQKKIPPTQNEEPEIKLSYFRGLPFHFLSSSDLLEQVVEFKPDPTDIFVVTYPKCGTTWAQYIVWEIINEGIPPPGPNKMMFKYFPFLEVTGVKCLHELPRPRLMKTHLPFHLQAYNPSAKYIYVVRNPWDCCASYYHHIQVEFPENSKLTFAKFFENFIQGRVPFGDFFDHVLSWYAHKNDPNMLFLTYENMTADRKGTILMVAKFLGDRYYEVLKADEDILNNCLKHTDFKYMKDLRMFLPKETIEANKSKIPDKDFIKVFAAAAGSVDRENVDMEKFKEWDFFRKGIIGDWKNYFSEKQIQMFNDCIASKLRDTDIEDVWLLRP